MNNFFKNSICFLVLLALATVVTFFLPLQVAIASEGGPSAGIKKKIIDPEKKERAEEFLKTGDAYARKGFVGKATEFWKIAIQLDPDLLEARQRLNLPSENSDGPGLPPESSASPPRDDIKQRQLDQFLSDAQSACDRKNYDEALKYLETAESLAPHEDRVEALRKEIVLEDFKVEPGRPYNHLVENFFEKAVEYFRDKHFDEASEAIEQAQKLDPKQEQVQKLKDIIEASYSDALLSKEVDRANNQWREGNGEIALEILANVLLKNQGFQEALDLQKEINQSSKKEEAQKNNTLLKKAEGEEKNNLFLGAKKDYSEVLKKDPTNKIALSGLDRVSASVDPIREKVKALEKALAANKKEKAKTYLEEIKELAPDYPKLGYWKEKIDELSGNETGETSEGKADEAYNMGLENYRKGNLAAAKQLWSEALDLNPQYIQAKRNLDRLLEEHPELK